MFYSAAAGLRPKHKEIQIMSASMEAVPATSHRGESASRAAAVRLRLTRRGRVVVGVLATLLVVAVLGIVAAIGSSQAVASPEPGSAEFSYVVVQSGSSLWEIAHEIDPSMDPRDLVAEIVRLNQLDGSGVQAGQPIALPLRYADAPIAVSASELGLGA